MIMTFIKALIIKDLCEKYDLTDRCVRSWFNRHDIKPKCYVIPSKFNVNFFLNYTEELAYVLAWLAADGCINCDTAVTLRLKNTDNKILKCIKALTNHESPIIYGKQYDERTDKINNYCKIQFNSNIVVNELKKYKFTPAKSLTLEYPDLEKYENHFIHGFMDGDGSISKIKQEKGCAVKFCGTQQFLTKLKEKLNELADSECGFIYQQDNICKLEYRGILSTKKILDAIYIDSTEITRLDRKYQIYRKYYDIEVRNVIQYDLNTGEEIGKYDSLSNAARKNKISYPSDIGMCCREKKKSAHGYGWK